MDTSMMVDTTVKDAEAYEDYRGCVVPLAAKHGRESLVRGGRVEVIGSGWRPSRLVLFGFSDREAIQSFMDDPNYQPLDALRHRVADTSLVIAEGVSSS